MNQASDEKAKTDDSSKVVEKLDDLLSLALASTLFVLGRKRALSASNNSRRPPYFSSATEVLSFPHDWKWKDTAAWRKNAA